MLDSQDEINAVLQFVSSNASKLLQVRCLLSCLLVPAGIAMIVV